MSMQIALDRARLPRSFYAFVKSAWHVIETDILIDSWHIEEMCRHCQAVTERRITRLGVALPPGFSKSLIFSVLWPAWVWINDPGHRWMFASVDLSLSKRDALKCKTLVDSQWYQDRWGDKVKISRSSERSDGSREYYTTGVKDGVTVNGLRFSTSVASASVGWHVDTQVVDDPIKPAKASSLVTLEYTREWWAKTMASRARDRSSFCRVILQQRLCPGDMIGYAVENGYDMLVLPMEFDPARYELPPSDQRSLKRSPLWDPATRKGCDQRTELGELLCPARVGPELVRKMKIEFGLDYGPQCAQDPTISSERVYSREQLSKQRWRKLPPAGHFEWDWDLSFKSATQRSAKAKKGSYVVGWCTYVTPTASYLVHEERDQWGLNDTERTIRASLTGQYKGPCYIENKANGPAIQDRLQKVPGIHMVEPRGSKVDRAKSVTGYLDRFYLPFAPWADDVISELDRFPSEPNDRGDVLSQHLRRRWLSTDKGASKSKYSAAMNRLARGR